MSSRAKDTRRRTKRSPLVRLRVFAFFIIVIVVLAIWGGFALATAPLFRVGTVAVTVTGDAKRVTGTQIVNAAHIDPGANAWLLNEKTITARINALPWIASSRISRTLPARVEIIATERVPMACLQAGRLLTIDATQRVLDSSCTSAQLTLISVALKKIPVPGETIGDERIGQLVRDLATLAAAGIPVQSLHLDRYASLVAIDPHGVELKFGDDEDLAKKATLIDPIRRATQNKGRAVTAIDVRAPQTPVVSYR